MTEFFKICSQIRVVDVCLHFPLYTPKSYHYHHGFEFVCDQTAFDPTLQVDCFGTHGR